MRGIISAKETNADVLIDRARAIASMDGFDLTGYVTCKEAHLYQESDEPYILGVNGYRAPKKLRVAAIDYGIKRTFFAVWQSYGCEIMLFPPMLRQRTYVRITPMESFFPMVRRPRCGKH